MFLNNLYSQVDGKELELAGHPLTSRILQKLLFLSNDFQLRVFMDRLKGHWQALACHPYASHVAESLLLLGADVAFRELTGESNISFPDKDEQQEKENLSEFLSME